MTTNLELIFAPKHNITTAGLRKALLFSLAAFLLQYVSFYAGQVNPHVVNIYAFPIVLWCALLFFAGPQYWFVLLGASFLGLVLFGASVSLAATYALALTAGVFVIVQIDRAFNNRPLAVDSLSAIFRLVLCSIAVGLLATLLLFVGHLHSPTVVPKVTMANWIATFERATLRCFLVFPALIVWHTLPKDWASLNKALKLLLFIVIWGSLAYMMFGMQASPLAQPFARGYLLFVLLPFVGLYLGAHGVILSITLLYLSAMWGSFSHAGSFYQSGEIDLAQVRFFMTCYASTGLITIVVIEWLKKQKERYTTTEDVFRQVIDAIPIPIAVMTQDAQPERLAADTRMDFVNLSFTHQTGYTSEELPDLSTWWRLAYPDEAYRGSMIEDRAKFFSTNPYVPSVIESWVTCRGGSKN